jgi:GMP synthase (glutamine-hydrolysing)
VQFHPEFSGAVMKAYVRMLSGELEEAGRSSREILAGVSETPGANGLLAAFTDLCLEGFFHYGLDKGPRPV